MTLFTFVDYKCFYKYPLGDMYRYVSDIHSSGTLLIRAIHFKTFHFRSHLYLLLFI